VSDVLTLLKLRNRYLELAILPVPHSILRW